jgi:hypothetical protein
LSHFYTILVEINLKFQQHFFMSKTLFSKVAKFASLALALVAITSVFPAVNGNAMANYETRIVRVKNLQLRNKNCAKINKTGYTLGYEQAITRYTRPNTKSTITCTVNGVKRTMIQVGDLQDERWVQAVYVPKSYTALLLQNNSFMWNKVNYTVSAIPGLNLRTDWCGVVGSVPNGTKLNRTTRTLPSFFKFCKIKGKYYEMMPVNYKGKEYLVASIYLK